MAKGRTKAEYDREIEQAIKRFKKYPEFLESASNSKDWQEFLENIGVHTVKSGSEFWESVREKTIKTYDVKPPSIDISELYRIYDNRTVYKETKAGKIIHVEIYSERKIIYRDSKTGRFIKRI